MGKTPSGFSATEIHDTLVENLRYAANMLAKEDILLLIEPINHFDMPGFHLTGTQQALALIKDIGSDNIKIQYDIYHMQRMEGELTQTMTAWADKIGHLQIADNPRRGGKGKSARLHSVDKACAFGVLDMAYLFRIRQAKNVLAAPKNVRETAAFFLCH